MLAPETVLQARYRIIRQLGQGGMGAVYEAVDERLDTTVALKETLFTEERLRKQFEREARLLARMHHPALPRVSDHFSEGDGQFLVMQFIAGDDLSEMMAGKHGPFPVDQVLTWADQLLDALDYLHTQDPQIIHRDIKPQNLKLTSRGQVILLDFGLAKGQTGGVSLVTTSASIFGYTPNYAPLEQIQGLGTDARSDIYSLSATLYHLMTALKPPDALTRAAALVNGQPDPLAPANAVNPAVGPEVAAVLARAMSQNREQRYASAAAMRAALKGTEEVATLVGKAEAATIILDRPGPTLAEAPATVRATQPHTGETTVVQTRASGGSRRFVPWAIAAALLLCAGVVFGFYTLQKRNDSTVATPSPVPLTENAPSPSPSQPETNVSVEPASGELTQQKPVDTSNQRSEPKKVEKAAKEKVAERPAPTPPEYPNVGDLPATPDTTTDNQLGPRRATGAPRIRTFPDGSQLLVYPDGRRVLVMPDGTRRPMGRVLRRRN